MEQRTCHLLSIYLPSRNLEYELKYIKNTAFQVLQAYILQRERRGSWYWMQTPPPCFVRWVNLGRRRRRCGPSMVGRHKNEALNGVNREHGGAQIEAEKC
jgi:hypothetical protein